MRTCKRNRFRQKGFYFFLAITTKTRWPSRGRIRQRRRALAKPRTRPRSRCVKKKNCRIFQIKRRDMILNTHHRLHKPSLRGAMRGCHLLVRIWKRSCWTLRGKSLRSVFCSTSSIVWKNRLLNVDFNLPNTKHRIARSRTSMEVVELLGLKIFAEVNERATSCGPGRYRDVISKNRLSNGLFSSTLSCYLFMTSK